MLFFVFYRELPRVEFITMCRSMQFNLILLFLEECIHEVSCIFELGNFEMYDVGEIIMVK